MDRICSGCGSDGPFYEGHTPNYCKPCARARTVEWQRKNPTYMAQWRERNPEARRKGYLAREYGLTPDEYDALAANQGGACAICAVVPDKLLCVDHDHGTGEVRGLLCSPCNGGLGQFRDDPELLGRAVAYLAGPPAQGRLTLRDAA